jgi:heat shock protein HslJ
MPMRRRSIYVAASVVAVVVVVTIVTVLVVDARSKSSGKLTKSTWTLTKLVVDGQEQALSPSHPATIKFDSDSGQASGSAGCNTFGAPYTLDGDQVKFGDFRTTLMACDDDAANAQETHFLSALPRVQTHQIDGSTMTLSSDDNRVQLTFKGS